MTDTLTEHLGRAVAGRDGVTLAAINGDGTVTLERDGLVEAVVARDELVLVDLDGDPYRVGEIGPWKVTECCHAYATGVEDGIVCKMCFEPTWADGEAQL